MTVPGNGRGALPPAVSYELFDTMTPDTCDLTGTLLPVFNLLPVTRGDLYDDSNHRCSAWYVAVIG